MFDKQKLLAKGFCKQILELVKVSRKIMKINLSTANQFWQQEEGQLTSADDLHQMVGLSDEYDALFSYVKNFECHFNPHRLSKIGMAHPMFIAV